MVIFVWMGIAVARNKPNGWAVLLIVPPVNLIVPAIWLGRLGPH
jgi:hypothetical protein